MSSAYIKDRDDFKRRRASEKNVLVQIQATARLINWELVSTGVYKKTVRDFVVGLNECLDVLVKVENLVDLVPNTYHYDPKTGVIHTHFSDGSDPGLTDAVVTYRFFFADVTHTASFDMTDEGVHVLYDGRISSAPGYNHKIGYEQNLTSVVGQGTLKLMNQDGHLDDMFDRYYFENQEVFVYSWNRELDFSEAQMIYRGRVTNKTFDPNLITFTIKDPLYDLNQPVPTGTYTEDDNVDSTLVGKSKRWIYGRVDGLQIQSLDKVGSGYTVAGTGSVAVGTRDLIGTGTTFLADMSIGDNIVINDTSFSISRVHSDTLLELSTDLRFGVNNIDIFLNPKTPPTTKNRIYQVSSHACSEFEMEISEVIQLNRFRVTDNSKLFVGDVIQLGATQEKIVVKTVGPNGLVVLEQSALNLPVVGDTLTRIPIQRVCNSDDAFLEDDFQVVNTIDGCQIIIDNDAEINIAPIESTSQIVKFISGSRSAQILGNIDDIKDQIEANYLVRSEDLTSTQFYSVIGIEEVKSSKPDYTDFLEANFPITTANFVSNFPLPGETGRVYKAFNENRLYAWNGTSYAIVQDIFEAPATNYNTTTRMYLSNDDINKYETGMEIVISLSQEGTEWNTEIGFANKVEGDVYIDILNPITRPFDKDDTIQTLRVLKLRTQFAQPTVKDNLEFKAPNWLNDKSIVNVNLYGKTKDNTPSGDWIRSGPEAVLDIVQSMGISNINLPEFDRANTEAPQILSLAIPQTSTSTPQVARAAINLINKSIIGSLNMDNNLDLQYNIIQPNIDEDAIPELMDCDVIDWKVRTVNGKIVQTVGVDYRHQDYNKSIESRGSENTEHSYDFVDKYIMTEARDDLDVYIYRKFDAEIRSHREAYHRSLSRSDIEITSDLRLEDYKIGDAIVLNFDRLYRRLGDDYNKKVVMVVGKKVTGTRVTLFTTDFGNLYNRATIITRNDAPCYEDATREEKLKLGFITDNRGIIDDNEDTHNNHLIS